jgi:hypothetical protein
MYWTTMAESSKVKKQQQEKHLGHRPHLQRMTLRWMLMGSPNPRQISSQSPITAIFGDFY